MEDIYKMCAGGTAILKLPQDDDSDDNYAGVLREFFHLVGVLVTRYSDQVLTIMQFPRECEKEKKLLYEQLGNLCIVELREDLLDHDCASAFLTSQAKNHHLRTDKKLFAKLEPGHQYLPDELRAMFREWYGKKLRTAVYPQYKGLSVCRTDAIKEAPKGTAIDELTEMIGLAEAKGTIQKALNYYKLQRLYKDQGIPQGRPAMHMVFTGNPGTAKTTAARLFARIMRDNELLSRGHLVEVGRADLVARFVGWTAKTVKEKFAAAKGGVLFIDEAYSLVDGRSNSFGDEAINTIVQEMENHRDDMVVIFAGYPREMKEFLDSNPGLRSRIAFHVPFEDYSTEELCQIAVLMGRHQQLTLSDGALHKLAGIFDTARQIDDFGNGRFVRNILELSRMNLAARVLAIDPDQVNSSLLTTIQEADIEVPTMCREVTPKPRMGFVG